MWNMIPNEISNPIFNYKSDEFEDLHHDRADTCEDVCKRMCQKLNIPPVIQLLFGLRISGTKLWLAGCRQLVDGEKYEFRIRFKIPKLSELNELDKTTYDYFYHQVRHDVLKNSISEITYPNDKCEILGLCVTDMYRKYLEGNVGIEHLVDNYKKYIPRKLAQKHLWFAQKPIVDALKKQIKRDRDDPLFVKSIYLNKVDEMAPNYLTEEYKAFDASSLDGINRNSINVKVQVAPFHEKEPGLRIFYSYKNEWQHIAKLSEFYTIQIEEAEKKVILEVQNMARAFHLTMNSTREIESFVSCVSGYYRLMVKWNRDLCSQLASPSLKFLTDLKIHGPIGGAYSRKKIQEKGCKKIGSYIVRQCDRSFNTFYIDIKTKEDKPPEAFKICYEPEAMSEKWELFDVSGGSEKFDDLISLAKSIPTNGSYFRLPPSDHDKSPLLLLCQSAAQLAALKKASIVKNPLLFRDCDLLMHKTSQRDWGDGVFNRMKAEWIQPNEKKIDVTLKILMETEMAKWREFNKLAITWANIDLSEIVRLHGVMLSDPIALVLESIGCSPLDEFLREKKFKKDVLLLDLVEVSKTLAKALHYLQEHQIVHGRIRCSTLQVMEFVPNERLIVKLGDPGLPSDYTEQDVPWIAIEDYKDLNASRQNLKSDIWAYSTTIWEIFSRGAILDLHDPKKFFSSGERLPKPKECAMLPGIFDLMMKGWDNDPEKRLPPQNIFSIISTAKTTLSRNYAEPSSATTNGHTTSHNGSNGFTGNGTLHSHKSRTTTVSDYYNGSMLSANTEHTYITSPATTQVYIENCGSSITSNRSHDGGSSQVSLLNGNSSNGSTSTIAYSPNDIEFDGSVLEFNGSRLIFQGEIGRGNYGCVYQGTMETFEDEQPVAIKQFKSIESNVQFKDFIREAEIMKKLRHENIVKIFGVCEDPLLIIMEFMKHGSLHAYVMINRFVLKVENLLDFAANIAKGMHYLEQQSIVHRDLAARNVLVANERCVKIADFGLAQITDGSGYYYATNSRALPLKWYAYETLNQHKFSNKSDVWSFGVTLFEMFSFGESPNLVKDRELDANEILERLEKGERLYRPERCPQIVYDELMFKCWNIEPKRRPTFAELLMKTQEISASFGESV